MKPPPFEYHRPERLQDALELLTEHADEARLLAGGQSLVPMLAMRLARPEHLVDLDGVEDLRGIREDGDVLRIGAMERQSELERSGLVSRAAPLVAIATRHVGHFQIRNRGTIGGSLAHADPAAEYPAVTITLGAELEVARPDGRRMVAAQDFFRSMWTTALDEDEVLVAAHVPVWGPRSGFAVEEVTRRYGDFALVGVACGCRLDVGGRIDRASGALFGVGGAPHPLDDAVDAMVGRQPSDVDPTELARQACTGLRPVSDVHATAEYRRRIAQVVVERAIVSAMRRASNDG